jgi:hypothetical protein
MKTVRLRLLDPYDPDTFVHSGGCEQGGTGDADLIRRIPKVEERSDYWWVTSSLCSYAAEGG